MTKFEKNMVIAIAVSTVVMLLSLYLVSTGSGEPILSQAASLTDV